MNKVKTRQVATRMLAFLVVVAISFYIFTIRDQAEKFEGYGYLGVFTIAFMAYATVFLPAPGVAVIATMGGIFNPLWVGIVAGLGAALGEIVGYLAGYSGQGIAEKMKVYKQLVTFTQKFGPIAVFVLAAIPNPVFDIAGAVAGTLKMPVLRFFMACWAGETIKMMVFSYGGAKIIDLLG